MVPWVLDSYSDILCGNSDTIGQLVTLETFLRVCGGTKLQNPFLGCALGVKVL